MSKNLFFIDMTDERCKILKGLFSESQAFDYIENLHISENAIINYVFAPNKKLNLTQAQNFTDNSVVFCGNISNEIKEIFQSKAITHKNFLSSQLFAIENAKLTAIGTIPIILEVTKRNLCDNKYLIFGCGRLAKALSLLLCKLNCDITLSTFSYEEYENSPLYASNCFYARSYSDKLNDFDVIINTIPSSFLLKNELSRLKNSVKIIELSSVPCIESSQIQGFSYTVASGIPTKFTPISAAQLMYDFITGEKNGETKT